MFAQVKTDIMYRALKQITKSTVTDKICIAFRRPMMMIFCYSQESIAFLGCKSLPGKIRGGAISDTFVILLHLEETTVFTS